MQAGDATDIDNSARLLRAHERESGFHHPDRAVEVGIDLLVDLVFAIINYEHPISEYFKQLIEHTSYPPTPPGSNNQHYSPKHQCGQRP